MSTMSSEFTDAEVSDWIAKIESTDNGKTWAELISNLDRRVGDLEKDLPPKRKMTFKVRIGSSSATGKSFGMSGLSLSVKGIDWSATGVSFGATGQFGSAQTKKSTVVSAHRSGIGGSWMNIFGGQVGTTLAQKRDKLTRKVTAAIGNASITLGIEN